MRINRSSGQNQSAKKNVTNYKTITELFNTRIIPLFWILGWHFYLDFYANVRNLRSDELVKILFSLYSNSISKENIKKLNQESVVAQPVKTVVLIGEVHGGGDKTRGDKRLMFPMAYL